MLAELSVGGDFNVTGRKTVVPSGTAGIPGRVVLASRVIPGGAQGFLKLWSAQVIDIGNADQIYFAVMRNGAPIQSGMERIPGIQFQYLPQIELGVFVHAGVIEIVGFNISGMNISIEPEAITAVNVNAQAWFTGSLLSQKGGVR